MNYPDSFNGEGVPRELATAQAGSATPVAPLEPPRLPETPVFPEPGIYFNLPEEEYHSIPALSNSGIKKLAASPMIFWDASWMNPLRESTYREHYKFGKAYHCRLMEGAAAFADQYVREMQIPEGMKLIESTDEIKAAIKSYSFTVTNAATGELELRPHDWERKVPMEGAEEGTMRPAKKDDWIKQLLEIDPDAPLRSNMVAKFEAENEGKVQLPDKFMDKLEISARVLDNDPGLAPLFKHGRAEVSLFWYCEETGVPMKARVDYMKITRMVDLKTLANQRENSIDRALRFEISGYKYNIQPSVYIEGARVVRGLVRQHGASAVHICSDYTAAEYQDAMDFAEKWASHVLEDHWTWVFAMKGVPVYRGVDYSQEGTTGMVTRDIIAATKKRFRDNAETFGTDPWLDIAPRYQIADEDIPQSATDF